MNPLKMSGLTGFKKQRNESRELQSLVTHQRICIKVHGKRLNKRKKADDAKKR